MIGILGGTFDPVHFGHLRPALEVLQINRLDQVRFIPNRQPPHREEPWLDVEQRVELLHIAVSQQEGFVLDERELGRDGESYMIDTLESLREDMPGEVLCLILGMDAYTGLERWHQWQKLPGLCHLIVTTRPGYGLSAEAMATGPFELLGSATGLTRQSHGCMLVQSVTQLDISASEIRRALQEGRSARYLMPDTVYERLIKMVKINNER